MKKLSIKKFGSLFLSAAIALSVMGTATVSAAEKKLIYGDADLDGAVTITDATEVQNYLAKNTEFGVRQEVSANVTQSEIDIRTVSLIQEYLAKYETSYPIGQEIDQGTDGMILKKNIDEYDPDASGGITQNQMPLYFSTRYNDVPFVDADWSYDIIVANLGKTGMTMEKSDDGSVVTFTTAEGVTSVINYDEKYIEFSDYDLFTAYKDGLGLDAFYSGFLCSSAVDNFVSKSDYDHYYGGDAYRVNFSEDTVPMIKCEDKVLIPLTTFNDLYLTRFGLNYVYNSEAVFALTSDLITDSSTGKKTPIGEKYFSVEAKDTVSEELAKFNYYELCLNLDMHYGLKDSHNISSFDSYLTRNGLKAEYLSGDVFRIEKANQQLVRTCFADFHSGLRVTSPYLSPDKNINENPSEYGKDFIDRMKKMQEVKAARNEKLGQVAPYERIGDTVFITFDSFVMKPVVDLYYIDRTEYDLTDTVELFAYSLDKLQNEDSDAKNVVIDVSCNTGGHASACAFALDAVLGEASIATVNANTNASRHTIMNFDLNLDGKIDENDKSIKELGKNISVITSNSSFSCGNLFPCNIKYRENNALMLGQTSGGGCCVVGYIATATGSFMQISSSEKLVTMKNGYIKDIDSGVDPDVFLTYNRMFNREYIDRLVTAEFT